MKNALAKCMTMVLLLGSSPLIAGPGDAEAYLLHDYPFLRAWIALMGIWGVCSVCSLLSNSKVSLVLPLTFGAAISFLGVICFASPAESAFFSSILLVILWLVVVMGTILYIHANREYHTGQTTLLRIQYAFLLVAILLIPLSYLVPRTSPDELANRIKCLSNIKQIALSLEQYAMDNDGHFPPQDGDEGLELLRSQDYLTDMVIFCCPSDPEFIERSGPVRSSYTYFGGHTTESPPGTVLVMDSPKNHDSYVNALYVNGKVKQVQDAKWKQLLEQRK